MKKYLVVIFFVLFVYIPASAQFVLSPKTAYFNSNLKSNHCHYFDLSLDAMYVFNNGLTIMSALDFPIVGNAEKPLEKYPIANGNFISSFMLGYTYKGIENIYITTTAGLSMGLAFLPHGYLFPLGIALQFDLQYYFNKNFGISFAIKEDALFLPYIKHSGFDFLNVNMLKIGATFKI